MVSESVPLFSASDFFLILKVVFYASWVLIPLALIIIVLEMWVDYRRALFFSKQNYVLLEIKVPRDVYKSPKAAEFFINNLFQTAGEKNWFERLWEGKVRAWFSLEITSLGGGVHFFIWTRKVFQNLIEANLYSQYPGIEITEVKDYTLPVTYDPNVLTMWVAEYELTKIDAYPIKTYIDYGMDKDPKEEFKIDPLTPLLEFLGGLRRDQQVWIQIMVRAHKAEEKDRSKSWKNAKIFSTLKPSDIWDRFEKKDIRWKEAAKKEVESIIAGTKGEKGPDGKYIPGTGRNLTDVEKDTIVALNRSITKNGYDVGIRAIYFEPKETFSPANIAGVTGGIAHFNSHLNGFRPVRGSEERHTNVFFAWRKRSEEKRNKEKQDMLDAYKRRSYYYKPYKSPHFILNSEELATIFHFPGGVSPTPTLTRTESRKAEAPTNIPV